MATRDLETYIKSLGYNYVIGVDEVGRGCLAGPVTITACILPSDFNVQGVKDSKKISDKKRRKICDEILQTPGLIYSTVSLDAPEIDKLNILGATLKGMKMAVDNVVRMVPAIDKTKIYACIDGNKMPPGLNVLGETVLQGDGKCTNIAAASIIAKVTRDNMMEDYDSKYPGWGLKQHKGYGTLMHRKKILEMGVDNITPLHRRSFAPLKIMVMNKKRGENEEKKY